VAVEAVEVAWEVAEGVVEAWEVAERVAVAKAEVWEGMEGMEVVDWVAAAAAREVSWVVDFEEEILLENSLV